MLVELIRFSNWCRGPFAPAETVASLIAQRGTTRKQLISEARYFFHNVPLFENVIGPTWRVSPGVGVVRKMPDGSLSPASPVMESEGLVQLSNYWAKFDSARDQLVRLGKTEGLQDLLGAVTQGVAVIE